MDAFSERRLEAAIVDVLALAAQGFAPLESLDRHVLPMLELLELTGRVEHVSMIGTSGRVSCWRLVMMPPPDGAITRPRALTA